jgi:sec-independent protein translocase protein TatB
MFDIGWSELLVIAVVAIVVVGPKDLPRLMRTFGHYAGKLRRAASEFQRQFEDAMRETEMEEVKKAIESVRTSTPSLDLNAPIDKPIMLPNSPAAPAPPPTNGTGPVAAETVSAEPAKSVAKAKRAAKPRTAASKTAAPKTTTPETTTPKTRGTRSRKAKAEPKP